MKILILDDNQARLQRFRTWYENDDCEVILVEKYSQCIFALANDVFDLVHLDYDLGEFIEEADSYIEGGNKQYYTGMDVVKDIIGRARNVSRVIVHSVNKNGRYMCSALNNAGISATWEPYSFDLD